MIVRATLKIVRPVYVSVAPFVMEPTDNEVEHHVSALAVVHLDPNDSDNDRVEPGWVLVVDGVKQPHSWLSDPEREELEGVLFSVAEEREAKLAAAHWDTKYGDAREGGR